MKTRNRNRTPAASNQNEHKKCPVERNSDPTKPTTTNGKGHIRRTNPSFSSPAATTTPVIHTTSARRSDIAPEKTPTLLHLRRTSTTTAHKPRPEQQKKCKVEENRAGNSPEKAIRLCLEARWCGGLVVPRRTTTTQSYIVKKRGFGFEGGIESGTFSEKSENDGLDREK
ncbi:hypothetical protein QL285_008547 [Trifolium repens]|nr:hypothetical protein QL285_008547 [Trifolium repens]